MKRISLLLLVTAYWQLTFGQQEVWHVQLDSAQTASSPRLTDLNNDGVLDVVIGDGIFNNYDLGHVNAIDGTDGSLLWRKEVSYDKFNSALFHDFTGDDVDDIVISGRFPELVAIDGTDGSTIWQFDNQTFEPPTGWKHFYSQQLLPDLTNDGVPEILAANGGEQDSSSWSISRPPGFLVIIDGDDGSLVSYSPVPDSAEVYCAPLIYDIDNDTDLDIIFGTGGETHPGGLWLAELSDLLAGNLNNATNLSEGQVKGFLGSPALADLNNDGRLEIIASSFDGYLTVVDGMTYQELWRHNVSGGESYVTPAIGYFNSDEYLDLFVGFGIGEFPQYFKQRQFLLSGLNGDVLFEDSIGGVISMSCPIAVDTDNDGVDEAYYQLNYANPSNPQDYAGGTSVVHHFDFNDNAITNVSGSNPGLTWGTTPDVKDMDNNGELDMIFGYAQDEGNLIVQKSVNVKRIDLGLTVNETPIWAAYQGSQYDGIYPSSHITSVNSSVVSERCLAADLKYQSVDDYLHNCKQDIISYSVEDVLGRTLIAEKELKENVTYTSIVEPISKNLSEPFIISFLLRNGNIRTKLLVQKGSQ
jgi:outer membrane protein assembly factor BamB